MKSEFIQEKLTYMQEIHSNYLVYHLDSDERLAEYQVKMLKHNGIAGIIPFEYFALEGKRELRYNLTGLVSLDLFFSRKEPTCSVLSQCILQIVDVLTKSESYLLEATLFLLETGHTFIDLSTLRIHLIYLPLSQDLREEEMWLNHYLQSILYTYKERMQPDLSIMVNAVNGLLREPYPSLMALKSILMSAFESESAVAQVPINAFSAPQKDNAVPIALSKKTVLEVRKKPLNQNVQLQAYPLFKLDTKTAVLLMVDVFFIIAAVLGFRTLKNMTGSMTNSVIALFSLGVPLNYYLFKWVKSMENQETSVNQENKRVGNPSKKQLPLRDREVPSVKKDHLISMLKPSMEVQSSERISLQAKLINPPNKAQEIMSNALSNQVRRSESVIHNKTELLSEAVSTQAYLKDKENDKSILLEVERFIIGRQADLVDLCLMEATVGRVHAEIRQVGETFYIVDLNSKNGTHVNQERIVSNVPVALKEGDSIVFSTKAFYFGKR